jgi:hypothetical protein
MRVKMSIVLPVIIFILVVGTATRAQEPIGAANSEVTDQSGTLPVAPQASPPRTTHRFWDRTNDLWFAGVAASRALDYSSTLNLRRRGDNEILLTNSIVDNHPLFAGIEAAATAASIGVSYVFHRTGHHRLERWTSIIHFGATVTGAVRNYSLKTAHNN